MGPVAQYHENSRYYSAVKPVPNKEVDQALPHITVEMPVYKESLEQTMYVTLSLSSMHTHTDTPTPRGHSAPSVFSLKKAMQTYARQGGTSAIFVHDDGLQVLPVDEREARIRFYADHNIGWVARPPHDSSSGGFKRAGRFKKASNLNYGLALSVKMERHLKVLEAEREKERQSQSDGERVSRSDGGGGGDEEREEVEDLEEAALRLACDEVYRASGERWRPWASNGRSIRIGEIVLLVDSDTIVPEVSVGRTVVCRSLTHTAWTGLSTGCGA